MGARASRVDPTTTGGVCSPAGHYREDGQMVALQQESRVRQKVATHWLTNEVLVGLQGFFFP